MSHRDRVMDGRRHRARPFEIAVEREVSQLGGDPAGAGAELPQRRCGRAVQQRLVSHVQADHRDRHTRAEHDVCRLRVGDDVELGGGGGVPLPDRAAHQAQVGDLPRQLRVEPQQQRDVRERTDRRDGHGLRVLREEARHQRHRALGARHVRRRVQHGAADAAGPMDLGGPHDRAQERSCCTLGDRHVVPPEGVEQPEGVLGAPGDVGVAADRGDGEQVDLRAGRREADRQRIVQARIAVDDQRQRATGRAVRGRPFPCPGPVVRGDRVKRSPALRVEAGAQALSPGRRAGRRPRVRAHDRQRPRPRRW